MVMIRAGPCGLVVVFRTGSIFCTAEKGFVANLADQPAHCKMAGDGFGAECVMIEFKVAILSGT
jgi:hypothetical protein